MEVLPPGTVCTETYIVIGSYNEEQKAANTGTFIKTKFVRFLVSLHSLSQHITRERFSFVPALDMAISWTDEDLYAYYDFTPEEIQIIETFIKEMP